MFNLKSTISLFAVAFAILFFASSSLEAGHWHRRHCHRSNVNVNVGVAAPGPSYVVTSPAYVVSPYAPVYVAPQPVVAYPVYQPVYVVPPRPALGLSFNWFFR